MNYSKLLVCEARTWVGTPFRHQGRLKGIGVDCAGVIICSLKAINYKLDASEAIQYPAWPDSRYADKINEIFPQYFDLVSEPSDGDIVIMDVNGIGVHAGVYDDGYVIHATITSNGVVRQFMTDALRSKLHAAFRLRNEGDNK